MIPLGVLLLSIGVAGLFYIGRFVGFGDIFSLIGIFNGAWILILAVIEYESPAKYEMEAPIVAGWGVIVLLAGVACHFFLSGHPIMAQLETALLSKVDISIFGFISVILVAGGILAAVAGARTWGPRKKAKR